MRKTMALSLEQQRLESINLIERRLAVIEDMQQRLAEYLQVQPESVLESQVETTS
ncbi:hypothetical protein JQ594_05280 [Bradyrhizobium manausense]|uniref:hypothetical protein n=1 Tax=Bradyrhizobium manausense TaxID=989370 RepID=UPI001BA6EC06|nr:hypothetical protein [Bradyrhizobium manausense]MBR0685317.1 hypothetical protein [Bradyrhizobium manausense]